MKNPETKRRRGGQPGNTNAVKSGRYSREQQERYGNAAEIYRLLQYSLALFKQK